jgi:hypothetical protein
MLSGFILGIAMTMLCVITGVFVFNKERLSYEVIAVDALLFLASAVTKYLGW